MTALVFEIPLPENLGNSRMHWAEKNAKRRAYWEHLDSLALVRYIPRPPACPMLRATATVAMRTLRQMDADNAAARMKWPLDWLQSRGYIVNDRDLRLTVEATTAPLATCGITLTLEEAA